MGLLDNFEKGLERIVGGAFARTFRSGLQPVEVAAALKRELDTAAAMVARDRMLAPNTFTVRMSTSDYERLSKLGKALTDELVDQVQKHAQEQNFQFAGGISVSLAADTTLAVGIVQIDSRSVQGEINWQPSLEFDGNRHPLRSRTVIGRSREADIVITDNGASRRHAELIWDGRRAKIRDMDSTNGTQVDGEPIRERVLEPDSVITIGRTNITFRVLAQAAEPSTADRDEAAGHTRLLDQPIPARQQPLLPAQPQRPAQPQQPAQPPRAQQPEPGQHPEPTPQPARQWTHNPPPEQQSQQPAPPVKPAPAPAPPQQPEQPGQRRRPSFEDLLHE